MNVSFAALYPFVSGFAFLCSWVCCPWFLCTLARLFWILSQMSTHSHSRVLLFFVIIGTAHATPSTEEFSSGPKCSTFDGVNATFTPWLIAFSAWVAWKRPELAALVVAATSAKPAPFNPNAITDEEQLAINAWNLLNVQLYGALVSYVSSPLQAALFVDAPNDGIGGLQYLRTRYGARSTGDRAEATARLQQAYIDSRARLSESDLVRQYDEMQIAAADIVSAGGTRPDQWWVLSFIVLRAPGQRLLIRSEC